MLGLGRYKKVRGLYVEPSDLIVRNECLDFMVDIGAFFQKLPGFFVHAF